jgi:hypothetical protein
MISVLKKSKKSNQVIQWKPMQVVMRINLQWRVKLYADKDAVQLLKKLVEEYVKYVHKENSIPVFVFIPQKDDVLFVKKNYHFYKNIIKELQGITGIYLIDILDYFLNEEQIDQLYSDNNDYGGHLSIEGNMKVASIIYQKLIHRFQDTFGIKE